MTRWIWPALLLLISLTTPSFADERILDFASEITVLSNGQMEVSEAITVRSESRQIRRGIYRDFPTQYKDRNGNNYVVDFDVIGVTRDGQRENWHSERLSNGVRIYMGSTNIFLPSGEHHYVFRYRTDRQLGHFDGFDELYWNVTGNDWAFPIDHASATVTLPEGVPTHKLHTEAYTGRQGERGQDFASERNARNHPYFETQRTLQPGEGLTIVTQWPQGYVHRPSAADKARYFLRDNKGLVIGYGGAGIILCFYLFNWSRLGRDPEKGTIIPRFTPPAKLSPAAARYIMRMGYDKQVVAAAVINMAVKSYLKIDKDGKDFVLRKQPGATLASLSKGEKALAKKLFSGGSEDSLTLNNTHYQKISAGILALKSHLKAEFHSAYFVTNLWVFVCGLLMTLLTIGTGGLLASSEPAAFLFLTLWLSVWTCAVIFLWLSGSWFIAIMFTFFECVAIGFLYTLVGAALSVLIFALLGVNILFYFAMKAPTRRGRNVMDEIEGFKMYLSTAEQDRLNLLHPPEKTPELFEKYLPYALALDVDQEWAEQFAEVFASAAAAGRPYSPYWYSGYYGSNKSIGNITSGLNSSLGSSISSASNAPGSSSGGGGGGFSGGGGGGGGGGGW
jgi:uncharacterized membrane protein YgcG